MTVIYHKPHKDRVREAQFFTTLRGYFPNVKVVEQSFSIDRKSLDSLVNTEKLLAWLHADKLMPAAKRRKCLEILKSCPPQLKVALDVSQISFDFVLVQNGQTYYWEFHEEQHRKLTVERIQMVFAPDGSPFHVPRYVQRLVRDVWRTLYFRPYTIVWSDWFAANHGTFRPLLSDGFQEFHKISKFSFGVFCQVAG